MMVMNQGPEMRLRHSYSREELLGYYSKLNEKGALSNRDSSSLGERPSALRFSRNRRSQQSAVSRQNSENNGESGRQSYGNGESPLMGAANGYAGAGFPPSPAGGGVQNHPLAGLPGGPQLAFFGADSKGANGTAPAQKGGASARLQVGNDQSGNPIYQEPMVIDPLTGWSCTLSQYNAQFQQFQGGQLTNGSGGVGKNGGQGKGLEVTTSIDGGNGSSQMRRADHEDAHRDAYMKALGAGKNEGTTLMLKNLPNKYNRQMLVELLLRRYKGQINFLYMPIDFKTDCNCGYCFINFRTDELAVAFQKEFDGVHTMKCLPGYNSNKIAQVTRAAVQGLKSNMDRLKRSPLLVEWRKNEDWQPLLFNEAGEEVGFPCDLVLSELLSPGASGKGKNARHTAPASPKGNSFTISRSKSSGGRGSQNDTGRMSAVPNSSGATPTAADSNTVGGRGSWVSPELSKAANSKGAGKKGGQPFSPGKRAFPHTVGGHEQVPAHAFSPVKGKGGKKNHIAPPQPVLSPFDASNVSRTSSQQQTGAPPMLGTMSIGPTTSHGSVYSTQSKGSNVDFSPPRIQNPLNGALLQQQVLAQQQALLAAQQRQGFPAGLPMAMPTTPANFAATQPRAGSLSPVTNPGSPVSDKGRAHSAKFNEGRSQTSIRISANFKNQVLMKDLHDLFSVEEVKKHVKLEKQQRSSQGSADAPTKKDTLLGDMRHLHTHMDKDGWLHSQALLALKNVHFPGHDAMRECLVGCDWLEVRGAGESFRVKDTKQRSSWKKRLS